MIVVRRTFFCKVGQASRVVDILREFVRITKESGIPFTNQHQDAHRLFEELSGLIDGAEAELFALEFRED